MFPVYEAPHAVLVELIVISIRVRTELATIGDINDAAVPTNKFYPLEDIAID